MVAEHDFSDLSACGIRGFGHTACRDDHGLTDNMGPSEKGGQENRHGGPRRPVEGVLVENL